jgi:hypothetical protein
MQAMYSAWKWWILLNSIDEFGRRITYQTKIAYHHIFPVGLHHQMLRVLTSNSHTEY